ncbi:MAG: nitroreductase family protein [Bacteroidaceae bacterium]|nr:nitroreductase family protein [Bacteroidaceae bacterium]
MKKSILTIIVAMASVYTNCAAQDIKLPAPDMKQNSMSVVEALETRHSTREFSNRKLTNQELSNLCWAACGVSRDAEHRTAPTAMNRKEIRLYAFTDKAVYEYKANENLLKMVADGDHRNLNAGNGGGGFTQDFVNSAPVVLVMVIDFEMFGSQNDNALMMGCVDAGNVSENINLYCQSVGMVTVPRATMDVAGMRKLLGLTDKQLPIMNNPVGFPK